MAYDEALADRLRALFADRPGVTEKKMFGGVAFLSRGSMFCGIVKSDLMVRVGPDLHDEALARAHARPMDFAGRPMRGFVYVAPAGIADDAALSTWTGEGLRFVATLDTGAAKKKPAAAKKAAPAKKKPGKAK